MRSFSARLNKSLFSLISPSDVCVEESIAVLVLVNYKIKFSDAVKNMIILNCWTILWKELWSNH
jgi:hypothetical protein